MTIPLCGKRRERKRLKRCAHARTQSMAEPQTDDEVVVCIDCGASKRLNAIRMVLWRGAPSDLRRKFMRECLPDRIARKATDA